MRKTLGILLTGVLLVLFSTIGTASSGDSAADAASSTWYIPVAVMFCAMYFGMLYATRELK